MTIKKRLFRSNILMVIVPVFIYIFISVIVVSNLGDIFGIDNKANPGRQEWKQFSEIVEKVDQFQKDWEDNQNKQEMIEAVDKLKQDLKSEYLSVSLFRNGGLIHAVGNFKNTSILETALLQTETQFIFIDKTAIHINQVGDYQLVLMDTNYNAASNMDEMYSHYSMNRSIFIFPLVIFIIVLTNFYLTRKMYKSITKPLDRLVYGVHQIRDGNLNYRIDYQGKDEFAEICSDFNEMSQRLLDMVDASQRDDENRRELIAGISHDLRTPLTSIKAYIEGIKKGVATTPEEQQHYLEVITTKADDLEHIVSQLFLFSKLDIGDFPFYMESVNLSEMLSKMVTFISEDYGKKNMQVHLLNKIDNISVYVDRVQLQNVFANIFENSLKYNDKEQGIVLVTTEKIEDRINVIIKDNGPGVPVAELEKLFNAFYRSDKARTKPNQGSGLGLAISYKIMERLDGCISAENNVDGGLSFTISLPILKGETYEKEDTNH